MSFARKLRSVGSYKPLAGYFLLRLPNDRAYRFRDARNAALLGSTHMVKIDHYSIPAIASLRGHRVAC
jgi:hypothetical protein